MDATCLGGNLYRVIVPRNPNNGDRRFVVGDTICVKTTVVVEGNTATILETGNSVLIPVGSELCGIIDKHYENKKGENLAVLCPSEVKINGSVKTYIFPVFPTNEIRFFFSAKQS